MTAPTGMDEGTVRGAGWSTRKAPSATRPEAISARPSDRFRRGEKWIASVVASSGIDQRSASSAMRRLRGSVTIFPDTSAL